MTKNTEAARSRQLELLGWLGTLAILAAYCLSTVGALEPTSTEYAVLNLFGGVTVGVISWLRRAWQPFTLNAFWALVALWSLANGAFAAA